jgi:hypothetical protein
MIVYLEMPPEKFVELKKKYPIIAINFKKSLDDAYSSLSDKEAGEHPREYYLTSKKLTILLRQTGFKNVRIICSYDKYLAVYTGKKK